MLLSYTVRFADGSSISLFANSKEAAILTAQELVGGKQIILVNLTPDWS
jgi:hypothetical protein